MNWKNILKEEYPRDEIDRIMEEKGLTEEEAKKVYRGRPEYSQRIGDPKMTEYAFSVSMFYDQNWVKRMRAILEVPGIKNLVDAAVEDAAQSALNTLNTLIEETGYESKVQESLERHKESTRLEAGEKPLMEPDEGGAGRGMVTKRTEHLLRTVSNLYGTVMEDMMRSIHEAWDSQQFDEDDEDLVAEVLEDKRIDDGEVEEVFRDYLTRITATTLERELPKTIAKLEAGIEGDVEGRNVNEVKRAVVKEMLEDKSFRSWAVHIFAILSNKIITGMAGMSEHAGEQFLGDVMTEEEKRWWEEESESREFPGMPGVEMIKPPSMDPETGIPKTDVGEMTPKEFEEWQKERKSDAFQKAWRLVKSCRGCRPKRGILDDFY